MNRVEVHVHFSDTASDDRRIPWGWSFVGVAEITFVGIAEIIDAKSIAHAVAEALEKALKQTTHGMRP